MKKNILIVCILALISCKTQKLTQVQSMNNLVYEGVEVKHLTIQNEIDLAYIEAGKGSRTILFIHGLGSYMQAWRKNFFELAKDYHCIAIDLPGYGHSSKGNYEGSMAFHASVIKSFLQTKGLNHVTLMGHSMGGQIALTLALQDPQLVDNLILIAPAGFETFDKGQKQWFRDVMTVDGVRLTPVEQIRINYAYNFYNMPEDANFMIDDRIAIRSANDFLGYCTAITKNVAGMVDQPIYEFLPQIRQKTLVIFGENDNLIPNRYLHGGKTKTIAVDGTQRMPNAVLEMLPKTGHFAQWEGATTVNALVKSFLEKQ